MFESKQLLILRILLRNHPREMYGLEIIRASEGKLSRGSVYVYLDLLEKCGEIASREEETVSEKIGISRRLYRLTDGGFRKIREFEGGRAIVALPGLVN